MMSCALRSVASPSCSPPQTEFDTPLSCGSWQATHVSPYLIWSLVTTLPLLSCAGWFGSGLTISFGPDNAPAARMRWSADMQCPQTLIFSLAETAESGTNVFSTAHELKCVMGRGVPAGTGSAPLYQPTAISSYWTAPVSWTFMVYGVSGQRCSWLPMLMTSASGVVNGS